MNYMIQEYQHGVRTITEVVVDSYDIEDSIRSYKGMGTHANRLRKVIVPNGVSFKRGRMMETQYPGMEVVFMEDKEIALLVLLYGGKS